MIVIFIIIILSFKDSVKIVHFIGANKPWKFTYNLDNNTVESNNVQYEGQHVNEWWAVFSKFCLPLLDDETVFKEKLFYFIF